MNRCRMTLLVVASLLCTPALAQEKKPESLVRLYVMVPKPGMTQQFEEGRKKHMDFHRKSGDAWGWETWTIDTGERTGSYVSVTRRHTFKELDAWDAQLGDADGADGNKDLAPFLSASQGSVWMMLQDVSRPRADLTPPKMLQVINFRLKQGGDAEFNYALKRITEAINKTNWPTNYSWFSLVNGGEQPHYIIIIPHDNWASMADLEPSFDVMLEKALGRHEAAAVTKALDDSVAKQWSEIQTYRPDLSYMPGK